jgi:very-short-patch-repair endonuclease
VAYLFSAYEVSREASPQWLGRQRLDIYIPELRLAIEYQGQQHYKSVGLFGGDEALSRTKERDHRKRELCDANGITLIYFRHDEALTEKVVTRKLKRFLKDTSSGVTPAR